MASKENGTEKVRLNQVNIAFHRQMLDLTEKLQQVMPKDLDSFLFVTTGSEAVEAAVKLARWEDGGCPWKQMLFNGINNDMLRLELFGSFFGCWFMLIL